MSKTYISTALRKRPKLIGWINLGEARIAYAANPKNRQPDRAACHQQIIDLQIGVSGHFGRQNHPGHSSSAISSAFPHYS
jgi:hypothetical protein